MELLEVGQEARHDAVVVLASGDVDSSTVDKLAAKLSAALDVAALAPGTPGGRRLEVGELLRQRRI